MKSAEEISREKRLYYLANQEKIKRLNLERYRRKNAKLLRPGTSKLLSNELLPQDAFVFLGEDITWKKYYCYLRELRRGK